MATLRLIHPVHGEVNKQWFNQPNGKDNPTVLKVIERWKKLRGKKFFQCEIKWDNG